MAKVSIMTMVFGEDLGNGRLTDLTMLEALKCMGFDGVELPSPRLLEPGRVEAYASYLADLHLEVTCIDGSCNFVAPDQPARQAGVDALSRAIDLAHKLKAKLVLAAGSHLTGDITPAEGRRMTAEGLHACLPLAKQAGATLAIEDFGVAPTLQCAAADCLEVLDAVPGLEFVFDTGNFYFCGEDPLENVAKLSHKTRYLHVKDWVKSSRPTIADVDGAALGSGLIPNQAIVSQFLALGRVTTFSLETGAPGNKLAAAQRDIETLKRWLQ